MNTKRIYLILLIVGAILGLAAVFYFFLWPFGDSTPSPQPAPLPSETPAQPFDPSRPPSPPDREGPAPDINDPAERERQAQEALKRQALDFSARSGSYSSADDFSAIRQVYPQSTDALVDFLESERLSLVERYPSFGPPYGRTTRSLSAKILSGTPVLENDTVAVEVQTQVVTNSTNGSESISYERVVITYQRSGDSWIAGRVDTEPLDL